MAEAMTIREQIEAQEHVILGANACFADSTKGRMRPEKENEIRTCYQRDVDRIVHSKAFRRLMHKTQVFLAPEGDHYRTRMTHTVEVMRIARTIARGLRLNEDLTEAAAFGHDLGHTPFGHAGERALNDLMDGGFRHNEQSLRVVDKLEKNGEGLNLCWEVRNGIVCHTGKTRASTLEGKIIHLADQIAYINHDIDDAMRAQIIYPMDIPVHLLQGLGFSHSQRINTLTIDVIAASCEAGDICQTPEKKELMSQLREFMFEAVYRNPVAKSQETKAQDLVKHLFNYYCSNPDVLPGDFQDIRFRDGIQRAACDYIAGMTDNFAAEVFADLVLPKAWTVK